MALTAGSAARSSTSDAPDTTRPTTRLVLSRSGAGAVVIANPTAHCKPYSKLLSRSGAGAVVIANPTVNCKPCSDCCPGPARAPW